MTLYDEIMRIWAPILADAGHRGEACGVKHITAVFGRSGGFVLCGCGAKFWMQDLLALRELRTGKRAPGVMRIKPFTEVERDRMLVERMERAEPAITRALQASRGEE